MIDENKPKEIEALTLDKFNAMIDDVLSQLEESKGFKKPEVTEEFTELKQEVKNPDGNNLVNLHIIGEVAGPMMVTLFNEETKQYISIYSNATICAKIIGLNPTTIRQRASVNKIIDNVKWSYLSFEEYTNLIK
jgi:hypothetical protein